MITPTAVMIRAIQLWIVISIVMGVMSMMFVTLAGGGDQCDLSGVACGTVEDPPEIRGFSVFNSLKSFGDSLSWIGRILVGDPFRTLERLDEPHTGANIMMGLLTMMKFLLAMTILSTVILNIRR